jgi:hypothetical protein
MTGRTDVHDLEHDQAIEERRVSGRDWLWTTCAAPDRHRTEVDGLRLYRARLAAGLTVEELEDCLLSEGIDATPAQIRGWEHERREEPMPAAALLALPRLLGVVLVDLVQCWTCCRAAAPSGVLERRDHERVFDASLIVRQREELRVSRDDAAALAEITPRAAELIERSKAACVDINDVSAYMEALDLDDMKLECLFRRVPVSAANAQVRS